MPSAPNIPWAEPLAYAATIDRQGHDFVLLYSSMKTRYSGRFSYLAFGLKQQIEAEHFDEFAPYLSHDQAALDNAWFGYLGYDLKNDLEQLPIDTTYSITLPNIVMMQFDTILVFDHDSHTITQHGAAVPLVASELPPVHTATEGTLRSPIDKSTYLQQVQTVLDAIKRGDLSQANLTRKFEVDSSATPFDVFCNLSAASPAPYSAYMRFQDRYILSSSPEQFMTLSADGHMTTRPIKGSAARAEETHLDEQHRIQLANSSKDRAENLMIVDLMRNDFSRTCEVGSVHVPNIFEIDSYQTIHHMSSSVVGQKKASMSTLEAVQSCFPPGSMTGTPKITAMTLCSTLETYRRQAYSGALGWFGGDGSADLSVVIRTLISDGTRYEFQVGGGIVWDSTPEKEWHESLDKAAGICKAFGLSRQALEAI